jgi:hypothetical protein
MQNGTKKTLDSRYASLYKTGKVDSYSGKQLSAEVTRTPPNNIKVEYSNEYSRKK